MNSERHRRRSERLFARYLEVLAFDQTAANELASKLLERCPEAASPARALQWLDHRLDQWLRDLAGHHVVVAGNAGQAALRAALLALEPGRDWPDVLLSAEPPADFVAAFMDALPLSVPSPAPLDMPQQVLNLSQPPVVRAGTRRDLWRALQRRLALATIAVLTSVFAGSELYRVFLPEGIAPIEALLIGLFAANFFWIALTFWSALAGLLTSLGREPDLPGELQPLNGPLTTRTALVMPIYNEQPGRIFAAIEAMYRSLEASGESEHFDFFILSDTTDANVWVAEELAWDSLRRRLHATGRLFYRRRFDNEGRKAGNLADFCRRWGGHYESMLVLDADSVMSGATIVKLAGLMEANPHAGILQTIPRLVNRSSLFARAHQFASACYGPVLARGLSWWYLGAGNYWGHNAIIRMRAFAMHAGMPVLSGKPPFGGHILSHDFVEAALMRRAGWQVHLVPGVDGSYEESPPSLVEHAARDRRWCQGNLQHVRIVGAAGLHPLSRWHLVTGIMAYLASPLWFAFIILGIVAALQTRVSLPEYFFPDRTPYPVWHVIDSELALRLFAITMTVLLVPKLLGWIYIAASPQRARAYGGRAIALLSVITETLTSTLMAPVHMLFQSRFVFEVLTGRDSGWKSQTRDDRGTSWQEAWDRHRGHLLTGVVIGCIAYAIYPALLAWLAPAIIGMVLAPLLSVISSRPGIGCGFRRCGLFTTPEERQAPEILGELARARALATAPAPLSDGLDTVIQQRYPGLLHLALLAQYPPATLPDASYVAAAHAAHIRSVRGLATDLEARLRGPALVSAPVLTGLRRRLGKFRS